jgi:hypothetical protein
MKKFKRLVLISTLFFLPILHAAPLRLAVEVDTVKVLQEINNEKSQFYLGITEFNFPGDAIHYAVPGPLKPWSYQQLTALNDFKIWEKIVNDDKPIELVITVIERRDKLNKPDRVIGLTRLFIQHNKEGQIKALWGLGQKTTMDLQFHTENNNNVYVYTQNGSEYEIMFNLYREQLPEPPVQQKNAAPKSKAGARN